MANETTYADAVTLQAAIASKMAPAFYANSIARRILAPYALGRGANTRSMKLPRSGNVVAAVVSEGAAATPQTVTDTSGTITIAKIVVVTKPTKEAERYSKDTKVNRHVDLHKKALVDKFDKDGLSLASGLSQVVDAGTTMSIEKVLEGAMTVRQANVPSDVLASILGVKPMNQIGNEIKNSSGAIFGNPNIDPQTLMAGTDKRAGFRGMFLGIEWWESNNVAVDAAATPDDYLNLIVNPEYALAALYDDGDTPDIETEVSLELGFLESVKFIKSTMWYQQAENVDAAGVCLKSNI